MISPKGGHMGIQDRDYWKERYDDKLNTRRDPRDNPFVSQSSEMSFLAKLILTIALLFAGALAYRYQFEILRFLKGAHLVAPQNSAVRPTEPTTVAPRVMPPERSRTESKDQIYRCGNTYSSAPCDGGQQIAQQARRPVDMSETKEIYLCKDFQDRLTWESVPCSVNGRFMDRIARVPANVSWDEQVAIARQQRDKAHAIAAEQVVSVTSRPVSSTPGECRMLDEQIRVLDAECRVNACGMRRLDDIREQRKAARDRQFRIGC